MRCNIMVALLLVGLTADSGAIIERSIISGEKNDSNSTGRCWFPELYSLSGGIITENHWVLSVVANGILLRGSGLNLGKGIGVQVVNRLRPPTSWIWCVAQQYCCTAIIFVQCTKSEGDGIAICVYAGYANVERIGFNVHTFLGFSMSAARGYHPMYSPCLKVGLNYNFASQE